MDLNTLWFALIAVLYIGFFVLEGFDLGVGILMPFLRKDDTGRRVIINTIGPHWDGNEVWLLTAGGATFAAFPNWYATLFSGFYLPLFLILVGLIFRGIALEFRSKDDNPRWRSFWDWAICIGSLIPALLFGVAFANFLRGVPIAKNMEYVGGFFNLLSPYALLGGVVTLLGFTMHGAVFLSLKTTGTLKADAEKTAFRFWVPALIASVTFSIASYFVTDVLRHLGVNPGIIPIGATISMFLAGYFIYRKFMGWAFVMNVLTIVLAVATIFLQMYPIVLLSSLNTAWSLTIYNASSTPYTLQIMSIVALIFVPIILIYQGWSYWIFRKRLTETGENLHY
jgi:cytochrome bd ubiquinol oxidase subunit II